MKKGGGHALTPFELSSSLGSAGPVPISLDRSVGEAPSATSVASAGCSCAVASEGGAGVGAGAVCSAAGRNKYDKVSTGHRLQQPDHAKAKAVRLCFRLSCRPDKHVVSTPISGCESASGLQRRKQEGVITH